MAKQTGDRGPLVPLELANLVRAAKVGKGVGAAWTAFVEQHNDLLLSAVRSRNGDHDSTMDRYAFVIESLRSDNFRRLRTYQTDGRTRFSTWLVVVAKRLMVDHHRKLYGRPQGDDDGYRNEDHIVRRRLVDLIASDVDLASVEDISGHNPELATVDREREAVLRSAIETLDTSDRLLLTLRFVDGATAADIAEFMGYASQFHVYRALRRVTRSLKRMLKERGVESPDDL